MPLTEIRERFNDPATLLDNFVVIFLPGRRDSFEHGPETRLTISVLRRKIGSTDKWFQVRRQPDAHRPAATAGRQPFGPLDAQTRQIMGNLLLDLWSADRKAVLFVTHDLEEAIALSDRVVIMSAGPAARIIGNWTVPLPRPRDIGEVKLDRAFHELHREIWEALKDEVMKGYRADGGRVSMSRTTLLALQILVAVVSRRAVARADHGAVSAA